MIGVMEERLWTSPCVPLPVLHEKTVEDRTIQRCGVDAAWRHSMKADGVALFDKPSHGINAVIGRGSNEQYYRRRTGSNLRFEPSEHQPSLRIRSYAHDRVVLTAYNKPPRHLCVKRPRITAKRIIDGTGNFSLRREVQAGLKIGGRFRKMPLASRFTVHARNMVRDAGHILEHYDKGIALFVTLTIAGNTEDVFKTMALASPVITNRFNTWLRERVSEGNYVFVWELQQRGAPHLHYLFRVDRDVDLGALRGELHKEWRKILLDISAETGVDLFLRADGGTWRDDPKKPRINIQLVRHDYARYLSKYCSKVRSKSGAEAVFRPTRWWGCSKGLRDAIKQIRLDAVQPMHSMSEAFAVARTFGAAFGEGPKASVWLVTTQDDSFGMLSFHCRPKAGRNLAFALLSFFDTGSLSCLSEAIQAAKVSENSS